jgi:hypothetical protein
MSWRGVSTARQIASSTLHAPALLLKWWASLPQSLCVARDVLQLRILGGNGAYFLVSRLVAITFEPLAAQEIDDD